MLVLALRTADPGAKVIAHKKRADLATSP